LHGLLRQPYDSLTLETALTMRQSLSPAEITWETSMAWKAPKIVEVPVGMEINMYACAARK
jgi:coenzyme PQQ precursor peptide PqqA